MTWFRKLLRQDGLPLLRQFFHSNRIGNRKIYHINASDYLGQILYPVPQFSENSTERLRIRFFINLKNKMTIKVPSRKLKKFSTESHQNLKKKSSTKEGIAENRKSNSNNEVFNSVLHWLRNSMVHRKDATFSHQTIIEEQKNLNGDLTGITKLSKDNNSTISSVKLKKTRSLISSKNITENYSGVVKNTFKESKFPMIFVKDDKFNKKNDKINKNINFKCRCFSNFGSNFSEQVLKQPLNTEHHVSEYAGKNNLYFSNQGNFCNQEIQGICEKQKIIPRLNKSIINEDEIINGDMSQLWDSSLNHIATYNKKFSETNISWKVKTDCIINNPSKKDSRNRKIKTVTKKHETSIKSQKNGLNVAKSKSDSTIISGLISNLTSVYLKDNQDIRYEKAENNRMKMLSKDLEVVNGICKECKGTRLIFPGNFKKSGALQTKTCSNNIRRSSKSNLKFTTFQSNMKQKKVYGDKIKNNFRSDLKIASEKDKTTMFVRDINSKNTNSHESIHMLIKKVVDDKPNVNSEMKPKLRYLFDWLVNVKEMITKP